MSYSDKQLAELIKSLHRFLGGLDLCFRDDASYTENLIKEFDNGWEIVQKAVMGVEFSDSYGCNLHGLMWESQRLRRDLQGFLSAVAVEHLKEKAQSE